ncbi:MAG: phage integrase SAM-like domain-containing protein [Oscillospiraceae bacterium]|nr:phage integrase SAM-like domain-containing protein [Oscillospiraceae bacterium]
MLARNKQNFNWCILPTFKDARIDRLTVASLQSWKLFMEGKGLTLNTKRQAFGDLRAMLNYAVKMEYLLKSTLSKIDNFKDVMSNTWEMSVYTPQEFAQFISTA